MVIKMMSIGCRRNCATIEVTKVRMVIIHHDDSVMTSTRRVNDT